MCRYVFATFRKIQFFLQKSGFVIVRESQRIECSGLKNHRTLCIDKSYVILFTSVH